MVANDSWREDLETWLAPFLSDLTHPAQRRMCPTYIAGLIGPGDRKSIQPLAARTEDAGYGHAFGMRPTADPITREWPGQAKQWLQNIGVL